MANVAGISDQDTPGTMFILYSVSTLEDIAAHEVALQIWLHYIGNKQYKITGPAEYNNRFSKAFNLGFNYRDRSLELVESLKTARPITNILKESLKKIIAETEIWFHRITSETFNHELRNFIPDTFDANHLVWHQSGEINFERSASKMIIEGKLTSYQRFIIMCAYSMADEIERFPMSSLEMIFIEIAFDRYELMYWISYRRNEMHNLVHYMMRKFHYMLRGEEYTSIDVLMATLCSNQIQASPHAFEYFWNRLNKDEQVHAAARILPKSPEYQKIILTKMSLFQQRQLVTLIPSELMINFFLSTTMPENAFTVWTLAKDHITEQGFAEFLKRVFKYTVYSEEYMMILINIWDTASDCLKRYVAEMEVKSIFKSYACFYYEHSRSGSKFFIKFLYLVNEGTRKEMIFHKYLNILVDSYDNFDVVKDIFNICLPAEADQLSFKDWIMKSTMMRDYGLHQIEIMEFDRLSSRMQFYSLNTEVMYEYLLKLTESGQIDAGLFMRSRENWNKLMNFIDTIFANDLSIASKVKKNLFLYFFEEIYRLNYHGYFDRWSEIAAELLSAEEMDIFAEKIMTLKLKISSYGSYPKLLMN